MNFHRSVTAAVFLVVLFFSQSVRGQSGEGISNMFELDTYGVISGRGEGISGGFVLDTTFYQGGGESGSGLSNKFTVNTLPPVVGDVAVTYDPSNGKFVVWFTASAWGSAGPPVVRLSISGDGGVSWVQTNSYQLSGNGILYWDAKPDLWLFGGSLTSVTAKVEIVSTNGSTASAVSATEDASDVLLRPAQKVRLCFGYDCPFTMMPQSNGFELVQAPSDGSNSIPETNQGAILSLARDVFTRAGITTSRLDMSIGAREDDAINVYFVDGAPYVAGVGYLAGRARTHGRKVPDRFNSVPGGEVVVYHEPGEPTDGQHRHPGFLADTLVHELGHCLGLYHIQPAVAPEACVMDYSDPADPWTEVNFLNQVTPMIADMAEGTPVGGVATHNEYYHLRRWLGGVVPAPALPGTWDEPASGTDMAIASAAANTQASLNLTVPPSTVLYNVRIVPVGDEDVVLPMATFTSLTAAQLANLQLTLPEYTPFRLVASSTPTGAQDITAVLAGSVATDPTRDQIPPDGNVSLTLVQAQTGGGELTLGTGSATTALEMRAPTDLTLRRMGAQGENINLTWTAGVGACYKVERSTDLVTWETVPGMESITAADPAMSVTDAGAADGKQKLFYRVAAVCFSP